jgi:hypothetical protein
MQTTCVTGGRVLAHVKGDGIREPQLSPDISTALFKIGIIEIF